MKVNMGVERSDRLCEQPLQTWNTMDTCKGNQQMAKMEMTMVMSFTTLLLLALASQLPRPKGDWKTENDLIHTELLPHLGEELVDHDGVEDGDESKREKVSKDEETDLENGNEKRKAKRSIPQENAMYIEMGDRIKENINTMNFMRDIILKIGKVKS